MSGGGISGPEPTINIKPPAHDGKPKITPLIVGGMRVVVVGTPEGLMRQIAAVASPPSSRNDNGYIPAIQVRVFDGSAEGPIATIFTDHIWMIGAAEDMPVPQSQSTLLVPDTGLVKAH